VNREDKERSACPECGAEPPDWYEHDPEQDWGWAGTGPRFHCRRCDAYLVIRPFVAGDHEPEDGDEVHQFIALGVADGITVEQLEARYLDIVQSGTTMAEYRQQRAEAQALLEEGQ
jgi:hypothetical protein